MPVFTGLKEIREILLPRITKCQRLEIPISATILVKLQTASESTALNMLTIMPENMLKQTNISTKEHSRLHLVNLYDSFLDCWSKTNCTPAKSWTPNIISSRTDFRFLFKIHRRFIKVTLFCHRYEKEIFC